MYSISHQKLLPLRTHLHLSAGRALHSGRDVEHGSWKGLHHLPYDDDENEEGLGTVGVQGGSRGCER